METISSVLCSFIHWRNICRQPSRT